MISRLRAKPAHSKIAFPCLGSLIFGLSKQREASYGERNLKQQSTAGIAQLRFEEVKTMMAYPYDDARIILALQIDHSRVAGYFAAHWGNQNFDRPKPYSSVVLAATEHDIGWWEWEMKPSTLNDKGLPLDYHDGSFKYLGQLRLDFYKNAVDRVLPRDPYAAMLMAMHGV